MDNRSLLAGASATPPAAPASPSSGYPTGGTPGVSPASRMGSFWYYAIGEELRALIVAGGLTPAAATLTQVRDAVIALVTGAAVALKTRVASTSTLKLDSANTSFTQFTPHVYTTDAAANYHVSSNLRVFIDSVGAAGDNTVEAELRSGATVLDRATHNIQSDRQYTAEIRLEYDGALASAAALTVYIKKTFTASGTRVVVNGDSQSNDLNNSGQISVFVVKRE